MTPVIFRKWNNGDIIALFPTLPADYHGFYCTSYEHVGQHGSAYYWRVVEQTRPAMPDDYRELLAELKQIGYDDLKVYRRIQYAFYVARRAEANRMLDTTAS